MIQLIEAPPRSGKSFYFVHYLSKFWSYDALYDEYILDSNVLIISNVEGLRVRHWKYPDCLKGRSVEEFFTIENFEMIMDKTGKNHIILGLDEVHDIFPAGYQNPSVYSFFAYHGHIGLDIFLMTQGISSMSRMFNPLLEFIVKVKPRSQKLYKVFSYDFYTLKGLFLYSKKLTIDQLVFKAYKSFRKDEINKPRSAIMVWVCFVVLMFGGGAGLFYWSIASLGGSSNDAPVRKIERYQRPNVTKSLPPEIKENVEDLSGSDLSDDLVEKWRTYYLDGVYEAKDKRIFIINSRVLHDSPLFRNYSSISQTVEFYGAIIRSGDDRRSDG